MLATSKPGILPMQPVPADLHDVNVGARKHVLDSVYKYNNSRTNKLQIDGAIHSYATQNYSAEVSTYESQMRAFLSHEQTDTPY